MLMCMFCVSEFGIIAAQLSVDEGENTIRMQNLGDFHDQTVLLTEQPISYHDLSVDERIKLPERF